MSGRFAPGEYARDRSGRCIPERPSSSSRSAPSSGRKTHKLLTRTPELAEAIGSAHDDGRNVFEAVPGMQPETDPAVAWPAVRAWAASLPRNEERTSGS